jgi:cytochrome P450
MDTHMPPRNSLDAIRVDIPAPPHVPKDRLVDLSWAIGFTPNDLRDPYEPCAWLSGPDIPRVLFNPAPPITGERVRGRGAWVVTHYDDIHRVYTDNENFSTRGTAEFQALVGETFRSIPLAVDPPEHGQYRRFLTPHFSPARLSRMEPQIRQIVTEMIDDFADRGEVDVAHDFGRIFPVRVFMELMGFPAPMLEQFLNWEWDILHSTDQEKTKSALRAVLAFLRTFMAEKEARPDENLVSKIVQGQIGGRPINEEEKIGMVWFLWLGGLDTVAATISQMFRRMVLEPIIQQQLHEHPELIQTAVEEFLRTQPILSTSRTATRDFEWHGVLIRKGDTVLCLNSAGNFDAARFACPRAFESGRADNRHFTFVAGVHVCLGAPLARRELRVLLEEWFKRIPQFSLKPGANTTVFPGLLSIRNLPIVWNAA